MSLAHNRKRILINITEVPEVRTSIPLHFCQIITSASSLFPRFLSPLSRAHSPVRAYRKMKTFLRPKYIIITSDQKRTKSNLLCALNQDALYRIALENRKYVGLGDGAYFPLNTK